jgi:transposase-like protein
MRAMAKHRSHNIEFKRQVAQELIAGETLHALAKRYDISRTLIRIWVKKFEAGAFDEDAQAAVIGQCVLRWSLGAIVAMAFAAIEPASAAPPSGTISSPAVADGATFASNAAECLYRMIVIVCPLAFAIYRSRVPPYPAVLFSGASSGRARRCSLGPAWPASVEDRRESLALARWHAPGAAHHGSAGQSPAALA